MNKLESETICQPFKSSATEYQNVNVWILAPRRCYMTCWSKLCVAFSHWLNCFHGYLTLGGNLRLAVAMSLKSDKIFINDTTPLLGEFIYECIFHCWIWLLIAITKRTPMVARVEKRCYKLNAIKDSLD